MKRMVWGVIGLFALSIASPRQAEAQVMVGPHVGYNQEFEELFVGANVLFQLPSMGAGRVTFNPGFEFYPGIDGADLWTLNFDALYALNAPSVAPYVGAGLNVSRISVDVDTPFGNISGSSTELGLNLKGGARFGGGRVQPFAEGIFVVADQTQFMVRGGFMFGLGGGS